MDPWVYVVLLGAFVLIFAWIRPKNKDTSSLQEMELILDQFVDDLEKDLVKRDDRLDRLENQLGKWEKEKAELETRIALLETKIREGRVQASSDLPKSMDEPSPFAEPVLTQTPTPPLKEDAALELEKRYRDIFEWAEKGKPVSYIAKKTGMNHGEIELILQLSKQGEAYGS